jgi:hypothetical protein
MRLSRNPKTILAITTLLLGTLACRAATRWIIPDTPTPPPTSTVTLTPTLTLTPTFTPTSTPTTATYEANCPLVVSQILRDAIPSDNVIHINELARAKDVTYIIHYLVIGDKSETPLLYDAEDSLRDEQEDSAVHQDIWNLFTRLVPLEQREFLNGFNIFTDGQENYLAAVNQSEKSAYRWELNVDILDATQKTSLVYTLLHEQGHLLTLNPTQVKVSLSIYHNPYDEEIYEREVSRCPQYFTGEGCSAPDSYIHVFFERFWTDLYTEWLEIGEEENERSRENKLNLFYDTYQDQFLTDYATTSPAEDIAETFTFFILLPKPELTSIANEKILFLYEYPELIELRTQILKNICVEFEQ